MFWCHEQYYEYIFISLGCLWILYALYTFFWSVIKIFRLFILPKYFRDLKKFGKWAVITGSTDGIGKAYARELACRGIDVILISRNIEKLETTSRELKRDFGVESVIIQADFSKEDIYSYIRKELKDMDIGILVNNVGQQFNLPGEFLQLSPSDLSALININMLSTLMMSNIILPSMEAKRKGIVVNVSSLSCSKPLPLMSVYSASKAFVSNLSLALYYEYRMQEIRIQCLIPSFVSTKLTDYSNYLKTPTTCVPDSTSFAKSAINTMLITNYTTGFWCHELQWIVYKNTPVWLWNIVSSYMFKKLDNR